MKKRFRLHVFLIMIVLTFCVPVSKTKAQPPPWAPAHGYRAQVRHVYFPDHNIYYDVRRSVYIYMSSGHWEFGVRLPAVYSGINLSVAAKVELEINTDRPQIYNDEHIRQYKVKSDGNGKGKRND